MFSVVLFSPGLPEGLLCQYVKDHCRSFGDWRLFLSTLQRYGDRNTKSPYIGAIIGAIIGTI